MRVSLCYEEDSDCSKPVDFTKYVLGYHFTEGTAGNESAPEGIYSVVMAFTVRYVAPPTWLYFMPVGMSMFILIPASQLSLV
jgi:hypothetical protein